MLKLKKLREAAGMRREELAHLSGVSFATVRLLERNGTDPRVSTVLALAKALNVSIEDLVHGE
jgi:transcriptional regulator with XRE-family HTH domain